MSLKEFSEPISRSSIEEKLVSDDFLGARGKTCAKISLDDPIGRQCHVACLFISLSLSSLSTFVFGSILICTSLTFHRLAKFYFPPLQIATMLPALRSTTNINRVLTQTLGVLRQHQAFRVPVQHSSAVSVLTDEQRALNLKIWPGNYSRVRNVRSTHFVSFRNSRKRSTDADRLLSDRSGGIRSFDRSF